MLHLALYKPSIPQNTGNIGRLCVGMGASLQIIGPCGFTLNDKTLKRAGLDYWDKLDWQLHANPEAFLDWLGDRDPWLVTKFGDTRFDEAPYADGDILIMGNENTGLPEAWQDRWKSRRLTIPMPGPIRAYNLANSAAIVLSMASSKLKLI